MKPIQSYVLYALTPAAGCQDHDKSKTLSQVKKELFSLG